MSHVRGTGRLIIEVEENVFLEIDAVVVMQIFSPEVKIIIPVSQVAKDLTNHEYDAIIVRSFTIMDMNAKKKR